MYMACSLFVLRQQLLCSRRVLAVEVSYMYTGWQSCDLCDGFSGGRVVICVGREEIKGETKNAYRHWHASSGCCGGSGGRAASLALWYLRRKF